MERQWIYRDSLPDEAHSDVRGQIVASLNSAYNRQLDLTAVKMILSLRATEHTSYMYLGWSHQLTG